MNTDVTDRTILITGAGSGMGRVEARALTKAGASVIVSDMDAAAAESVATELGERAHPLQLDVTDPDAWQRAADDLPVLHGLVNNAGVSFRSGIAETSITDWHRVLEVNCSSVFYGMKFLRDSLAAGEHASVVNISSIAGMLGYFSASYGASKWGVRGLSKVAALEFAPLGIRVNSIHPGLVDTPLLHSGDPRFVQESLRSVPVNRVAAPEEVANTVLFLLSTDSSYVNGTELVVDGGLVAGGTYHRITTALAEGEPQ